MPQDYSSQNLRGRSFKGQNLEAANFAYADIRGTNFTGANLKGASFSGAKAGLQKRWALLLVLVSCLMSGVSGYLLLLNGVLIAYIFNSSSIIESQVAGWLALIVTVFVYIIIIRRGIGVSLALALVIAGILAGIFPVAFSFGVAKGVSFTIAGAVALAFTFTESIVIALTLAVAGMPAVMIALTFVAAGALLATVVVVETVGNLILAGVVVGISTAVSVYTAWQAMKGDKKYALVQNGTVALASFSGTSFGGADLTDTDFTKACLKSTNLRNAKLIRTCFHKTKLLDRVRPGDSYLQYPQVRQLILTGQGQDKNFDRFNLRGINLKGALLTDASFIGADLSEACLQDADLSRVKLVKTQLDGTDFTGAILNGAYTQDWNITHDTNFRGVKCEYVYMRLPTKENPNPLRKPDNNGEVFTDGDFSDFIQPIFDTLDLYHNQGVDPRAIAISFKQLAESNPNAELEIVAMEKRGEDKFLLRAKTSPEADKSQLSAEYFETYSQIKALAEQEVKALIMEKDGRIRSLENMVNTALKSPNFYAKGDNKMSGDNIHQEGSFGVGVNKGEIKAEKVAGTINEAQQQNIIEAAAEIQALLEQLDKTYSTDTTVGKMTLATEAIAQIEGNPSLAARILSALKTGGVKAFERFLSHPAASFVAGALEDWRKTKGELV